jgi:hypothetical protein
MDVNNTLGGKAIASGGFGCVFYPALKCKDSVNRDSNKISKLFTNKYALTEYNEIQLLKPLLKQIPNYSDFFIINNLTLCTPDKLSSDDLINFNNKCNSITNKTDLTINNNLDEFKILNMPYGGITISNYILNNINVIDTRSYIHFININNSLIKLLKNGIIPMNNLNIYHGDIKESNILIDIKETPLKPKIIDWGLTIIYNNNNDVIIPKQWWNRPLQFNVPFSNILFSTDFFDLVKVFISNKTIKKNLNNCKTFMKDYMTMFLRKNTRGHHLYIQYMFSLLFENKSQHENIIIDYNSKILFKFKGSTNFDFMAYINTVYKKNVDVWGFIVSYIPILELLVKNEYQLSTNIRTALKKIKQLFIKYLYNTSTSPIDINMLTQDLQNINLLFNTEINKGQKKNVKTKKTINSQNKTKKTVKTKRTGLSTSMKSTKM